VHPWAGRGGWSGHGVLIQHRPGKAHSIWHFWEGDERRFAGWYVNMQAPYVRYGRTFRSQDHELDIWVRADGSWEWKDEDELEDWVRRGRFTRAEVREIRAEGERVLAAWPFPTGWEGWTPDPSWAVPDELPADWRPPE
jgi:predicted RNA-binding protein associated with RNAse of E/G family